ncbi:hypothetical protein HanXRQr2_Chr12g0521591 [Helianthus annuus]|uniref:Uncharacterized protein n=1 Tax=Helianthus annuus TaxID=4232 RepID=A0A9K3HEN7_HELAN|nr:hypothetical protein HanXRQr2_Chr12g0521591 [Helianthus annuus]
MTVVAPTVVVAVAVAVLVAFGQFFRFVLGGATVFAFFGAAGHGGTPCLGFRFGGK